MSEQHSDSDSPAADSEGPDVTKIALFAAAGALITFCISTTSWWIAGESVSEFPAWLEAWATVAAVGAAIVAGVYAAWAFRLEFKRERRWEDAQLTAQASLVAAWWGRGPAELASPAPSTSPKAAWFSSAPRPGILLRNASEVPVTEVDVFVRRPDTRAEIDSINVGLLPPAVEPVFQSPTHGARSFYAAIPQGMVPEVTVVFTDAAGNRWERSPSGELSRTDRVGTRTIYNLAAEGLRPPNPLLD